MSTTMPIPIRLRWLGWLTRERLDALPNSRQGFTARFAEGELSELTFSVILTFPPTAEATNGTTMAALELLAPENLPDVAAALTEGCQLRVFSGPRAVADCEILAA